MQDKARYLSLDLAPAEPYAARYLVPHSGLQQALSGLEEAVATVSRGGFRIVTIVGPAGSGKTHLLNASLRGVESWIPFSWSEGVPDNPGRFISEYEKARREGGIVTVETRAILSEDPHVLSRLAAGPILEIEYPSEEELEPLLRSLLERRNLNLSSAQLSYLIKRLPKMPLSFDSIFATLNDLSLSENKPVKRSLIKQAMRATKERTEDV